MGRLMRETDWSESILGDPRTWPQSLRVATRLMLSSNIPMVIWWGTELVQLYNDAFRKTMGPDRHPSMFGLTGNSRDDAMWRIIIPAINSTMAGVAPVSIRDAAFYSDGSTPLYWDFDFSPIDRADSIGGVLGIGRNVSEDHADDEQLTAISARVISLFETCPGFVAMLSGPDHVFEFVNQQYKQLMGNRDYLGRTAREVFPDLADQEFFELLDRVYQTGETFSGKNRPIRYRSSQTGHRSEVLVDVVFKSLIAPGGDIYGIFVEGTYSRIDSGAASEPPHMLTQREREVLAWIALGKTAAETATIMHLSKRTCETHIYSAARKFDTANSIQTVVEAIRRGELRL